MVRKTSRGRARAVGAAEAIIDEEVAAFDRWINDMRVAPLIGQIYRDVRALAEVEVRRLFNRCPDLSSDHQDEVTQLVDRLVGKLLHPCVSAIRQGTQSPPRRIFAGSSKARRSRSPAAPELEQYA